MLHITIIAVGRLKEKFWSQACDEYLKRLRSYANVSVKEIPDIDPAKAGGEAKAVRRESESILAAIPQDAVSVLMDIEAKQLSSEDISQRLEDWAVEGKSRICIIIGGSCGVDGDVRSSVTQRWSLGRITLPHNLARVVVLEQLYRAFKIMKGEPYHK